MRMDVTRNASLDEIVAEMDRRGAVLDANAEYIERLKAVLKSAEDENRRLRAENERLRAALVDHNDLLRSAFQAAQRDAIAEVQGTTSYNRLADSVYKVLATHHAITNEARAALAAQPAPGGKDE